MGISFLFLKKRINTVCNSNNYWRLILVISSVGIIFADVLLSVYVSGYSTSKFESYLNGLGVEMLGLALPLWVVMKIQNSIESNRFEKKEQEAIKSISLKLNDIGEKIKMRIYFASIDPLSNKASKKKLPPLNFLDMEYIIGQRSSVNVKGSDNGKLRQRGYHGIYEYLDQAQRELEYEYIKFDPYSTTGRCFQRELKLKLDKISDRFALKGIDNSISRIDEKKLVELVRDDKRKSVGVGDLYEYLNGLMNLFENKK